MTAKQESIENHEADLRSLQVQREQLEKSMRDTQKAISRVRESKKRLEAMPDSGEQEFDVIVGVNVCAYATVKIVAMDEQAARQHVLDDFHANQWESEYWEKPIFDPCWETADDFRTCD